jgi:hypothetical protein
MTGVRRHDMKYEVSFLSVHYALPVHATQQPFELKIIALLVLASNCQSKGRS